MVPEDTVDPRAQAGETAELRRLREQLSAPSEADRLSAVAMLAGLGTPEALTVLAQSLESPDTTAVDDAVVRALAGTVSTGRPTLEALWREAESDAARARLAEVLRVVDAAAGASQPTSPQSEGGAPAQRLAPPVRRDAVPGSLGGGGHADPYGLGQGIAARAVGPS